MARHTLDIDYYVRGSTSVVLDVPEGLSPRALDDWLENTLEQLDLGVMQSDVEIEGHSWIGDAPVTATPSLEIQDAEEHHWFDVMGHRWLTDDHCAVREDSAMPTRHDGNHYGEPRGWLTNNGDDLSGIMRKWVKDCVSDTDPGCYFDARFAPLLTQGRRKFTSNPLFACLVLDHNDEPIALVMPMCGEENPFGNDTEMVRADGTPVKAGGIT